VVPSTYAGSLYMPPRIQIKDLGIILKDFEPMVKKPRFLRTGRRIPNFNLLPREAWANWLLCVVLRDFFGRDITFAEAETADGLIHDRDTGVWFLTEHVSALKTPGPHSELTGEERVLYAIQHKINYGEEYARNKRLVVFIEDTGLWYPNRVGKAIRNKHNFDAVYVIGIESNDDDYVYSVSQLDGVNGHSPTWRVRINEDFTTWTTERIQ
jgi:hypothetical protein